MLFCISISVIMSCNALVQTIGYDGKKWSTVLYVVLLYSQKGKNNAQKLCLIGDMRIEHVGTISLIHKLQSPLMSVSQSLLFIWTLLYRLFQVFPLLEFKLSCYCKMATYPDRMVPSFLFVCYQFWFLCLLEWLLFKWLLLLSSFILNYNLW